MSPSGDINNRYSIDGVLAIKHELSSKVSQRLGGWNLIIRDVQNIRSWIAEILAILPTLPATLPTGELRTPRQDDQRKHDTVKGLFVAVLNFYAKQFSPSKGRLIALNKQVLKDPSFIAAHDQLMAMRHTFAAHSGAERVERCAVIVAFVPLKNGAVASKIVSEVSQPSTFRVQDYQHLDTLMKFWADYAESKSRELEKVVRAELAAGEMLAILRLYEKIGRLKIE